MEAVTYGLIAGGATSFFLVFTGILVVYRTLDRERPNEVNAARVYLWLTALTALMVGQMVLTGYLVSAFAAAPSQTNEGVTQ